MLLDKRFFYSFNYVIFATVQIDTPYEKFILFLFSSSNVFL